MTCRTPCLAIAIMLLTTGLTTSIASAGDRCSSPYVWGHQSYFGDRFVYSHRHAYPRHTYRSSQHYIYYRRVPHFYASHQTTVHTSNYYRSPEYRAYYQRGPYLEPSAYSGSQRYRSPDTRPYTPICQPDADGSFDADVDAAAPEPMPVRQPLLTVQERRSIEFQQELADHGRTLLANGWALLNAEQAADAMPVFAEAAMLRTNDAAPRLGYGLAAALNGQDAIASWALRRAMTNDPQVLVGVELSDELRRATAAVIERCRETADKAAPERDQLVLTATLAVLLDDDEAMRWSIDRLLELNERDTVRVLAVAARAALQARLDREPADDFPWEFVASRTEDN